MLLPAVAFLEDEFDISRKKAVKIIGIICFILCHAPILFITNGVIEELDLLLSALNYHKKVVLYYTFVILIRKIALAKDEDVLVNRCKKLENIYEKLNHLWLL